MSEAEYNLHGVELAVLQRRRDHEGARTFRTKDCDPWPLPSYCESCRAHMLFFSAPKSALPLRDLIQLSGASTCINGSTVISRAAIAGLPYHFAGFPMEFSTSSALSATSRMSCKAGCANSTAVDFDSGPTTVDAS